MKLNTILVGDVLEKLKEIPDESIDCIVTSPPYFSLRDYGVDGQIGLEPTLTEYLHKLLLVTGHLKRVLKPTGTLFWNHGDSYGAGTRKTGIEDSLSRHQKIPSNHRASGYEKSLLFQNFRLAQQMVDGQHWILRNVIIWHKLNCMPSSVKDRFTVDFEPVFFFVKSKRYYFNQQFEPFLSNSYDRARMAGARTEYGGKWAQESGGAIKTQRAFVAGNKEGRTKRCVWSLSSQFEVKNHYATFPTDLIMPMIKAGCPEGGIVLDPFLGSGTTAVVANKLRRDWIGIELNPKYVEIAKRRIAENPKPML